MPDQNESRDEKVRRLRKELADLNRKHTHVCKERDRLAANNNRLKEELEQLESLRSEMIKLIAGVQASLQRVETEMAESPSLRESPEFKAYMKAKRSPRG